MASKIESIQDNVDVNELQKFADLAHRWWDKNSEFKPLHEINPLRLAYINQSAPLTGKSVIDVGCGGGILSESMAQYGAEVTGIDLGEKALNVAKIHLMESGLKVNYQLISAEQMAIQHSEQFDMVTCMEMLEHVPDPYAIVLACAKLVKPGGDLFFSTLNRNPKAYLLAVLGAEYILNLLPKGTHEYARFIKPSELAAWANSSGLSLIGLKGIEYRPFSKIFQLSDDVSVNYMMHFKKTAHDE